ncbi:unnamed protein product [Tilletia laevis]|uniref:DUF1275 domain protein n=3 Tax=Tilletia TaxID=13289 RepID=A0A8X7MT74_9BASI|nr:hypothetical protein CF336_g3714 [Tilletia laevis]KAE8247837.1 hypothetical protein A4X06_0g4151 [Tilletia controversa]KAE8261642.1 hypothetical protein A4X03_0g3085 [Tilletia caries]KAE8203688.1 hypothetical protein CF335_g2931 [Tilletia laevis]CAD6893314.1 unnamed protein product [Tilletia caries]
MSNPSPHLFKREASERRSTSSSEHKTNEEDPGTFKRAEEKNGDRDEDDGGPRQQLAAGQENNIESGDGKDEGQGEAIQNTSTASPDGRGMGPSFLHQRLAIRYLPIPLIVTSIATGLLDVATYADFFAFASNQTGNQIVLFVALFIDISQSASALLSGVSLASFCFFALIFGQLSNRVTTNGPRTRWWLFVCGIIQALMVLVVAILVVTGLWKAEGNRYDAAKILTLLGGSGGIQVVNAKLSSVAEIPTAVVTSPWVELLSDPHLFSPHIFTKEVRSRNLRAMHIGGLMLGSVIGGLIRKYAGSAPIIFLTAGIKILIACMFLVLPGDA